MAGVGGNRLSYVGEHPRDVVAVWGRQLAPSLGRGETLNRPRVAGDRRQVRSWSEERFVLGAVVLHHDLRVLRAGAAVFNGALQWA